MDASFSLYSISVVAILMIGSAYYVVKGQDDVEVIRRFKKFCHFTIETALTISTMVAIGISLQGLEFGWLWHLISWGQTLVLLGTFLLFRNACTEM